MSITSSAGPIPMEDGPARLEAYEAMTRQIQTEYQDIARKLEDLRNQNKTSSARFRELLGQKLMLSNELARLKAWRLL
ncbi:hypothetical protein JQM64_04695 [Fournierella massiliensis]|nr:hypothetical protein [Fournierella massiliensis]MCF2556820.1 hypothetical protein [Fournierella massiliensis]